MKLSIYTIYLAYYIHFIIVYYIQQSKPKHWRVILTKLYFLQAYFKINVDIFSKKGHFRDSKRTPKNQMI